MREYAEPAETFREAMIVKLELNDHKAHWSRADLGYLIERCREELEELQDAYIMGTTDDIMQEAVDVGNFAMMIYDNARAGIIEGSGDREELEGKG